MEKITSVIDNIASAQEGIASKIEWVTDAASEVPTTEILALIVNDYMIELKRTIAELRKLGDTTSNIPVKIGGSGT